MKLRISRYYMSKTAPIALYPVLHLDLAMLRSSVPKCITEE